jgi:ribosomal protein L37AE/L43A
MDGVVWLFLTLILVAVGFLLAGFRRRSSRVENSSQCPNCQTPMSMRRVSLFQLLTFRGIWMCPHCGARISKMGRVAGTAA